jgi:uncharacterized protein with ParB-like and HNH nuclease domain
MSKLLERSSNNISISNFYEEYAVGKYEMNPPYQRLSVWSTEKKAFFIDSILKNLPIPPIFLRQKIDDLTGKTRYEVIDGKQRLSSIIEFIEGPLVTADEADDPFHDEDLAGKCFSELEGDKLGQYKKLFWRYQIPVEYIDTGDPVVIDRIFDRLNRNGEPLTGQELRHSNYYSSPLLALCYQLSKHQFWSDRLVTTDKSRMEDVAFISELVFVLLEKTELTATDEELDKFYTKYAFANDIDWKQLEAQFELLTNFIIDLGLDYENLKISGVSHLYGLWCFAFVCIEQNIQPQVVADKLLNFFELARQRDYSNPASNDYKLSMSNRTKFKGQRTKRKNALLAFCEI